MQIAGVANVVGELQNTAGRRLHSEHAELDYCAGRVIRILRCARKMTGEELGYATGYSQQQVSRYECGRCRFTFQALSKFSESLDITIWDLFDEIKLFYFSHSDCKYPNKC